MALVIPKQATLTPAKAQRRIPRHMRGSPDLVICQKNGRFHREYV